MKKFECMNCGEVFTEEELADVTERHDEVHPHYIEHFYVCPYCLSGSYIDLKENDDESEP